MHAGGRDARTRRLRLVACARAPPCPSVLARGVVSSRHVTRKPRAITDTVIQVAAVPDLVTLDVTVLGTLVVTESHARLFDYRREPT